MGKMDDYGEFHQRAHYYKNVFDASTGFMRGKTFNRKWLTPFDPKVNSAYSEGNAYQYMFVPHDVDGLMHLMGGDKKFGTWLDTLFFMPATEKLKIGEYWHGNEPGHHLPYLYDYAGEPWKTQYLTRKILTELYRNETDGLAGNEDCGQMSGWYIFSALGFYPVSPGQKIYAIGSPLFRKAVIHLENGKKVQIVANNNSPANFYIQSATLNGKEYANSYFQHDDLMKGAEISFKMGPEPNKSWGHQPVNRPYSENGKNITRLPYLQSGDQLFENTTRIELGCDTKGAEIHYTLNGSLPDLTSAVYRTPFEIGRTTVLRMKAFHPDLVPSQTIETVLKKAELNDAVLVSDVRPGLEFDYFERFFVQATDMDLVRPLSSSITPDFNFSMARIPNYFGLDFKGFIKVPEDGIYTFYLASNDGSYLYLDGKELIENDGNHATAEEPANVALKAGYHAIEVKYMQCGGGKSLKVSWEGPGIPKQEIPSAVLFSKK
jgi:hypothetical protein